MHRMDSVTNQNHSQQTIYYTNGSVLGQINRTILQSVQILRPECGELHQSRPDRVGRWQSYVVRIRVGRKLLE